VSILPWFKLIATVLYDEYQWIITSDIFIIHIYMYFWWK